MKLGMLTVPFSSMPFAQVAPMLAQMGIQAVELGTGGYPGNAHCNPKELLQSRQKLQELKDILEKNQLVIGALSCHGNPVHPDKAKAQKWHDDFVDTVMLANQLGVNRVVTFSGCPGDGKSDMPNWVTCPWPEEFSQVLQYQWEDVLIPYWQKAGKMAMDHGVDKIALEMHPGFCVYNTATCLRLRAAVGDVIGANFDPSHLFWQGIDPVASIKALGSAVHFFHAKDTCIDAANTAVNGVLDVRHYGDELGRSWVFRTVGYGHDAKVWKDMASTLRMVGYDHVMSIEHEDGLMSQGEGLRKAISFLKEAIIFEDRGEMFWA